LRGLALFKVVSVLSAACLSIHSFRQIGAEALLSNIELKTT